MSKQIQYRDSITGKFITEEKAKKNPDTTEKQKINHPSKKKSK